MKDFFLLLVLSGGLLSSGYAQKPVTGCPKIIFNSRQVADSVCDPDIKRVGMTFSGNKVMIRYKNGSKKKISADSVWGIRNRKDYPYRIYNRDYYTLCELRPVYKYSRRVGKSMRYYFSNNLDSAIYPYDEKYLKKHADSAAYAVIVKDAETNRHELAFDFYTVNTRMLNKNIWSGGLDMKYFPVKKWATGLSLVIGVSKISDTFSFSIKKPLITYIEFGWLNQYDVINKEKFRANINLVQGVAVAELQDNGEKILTRTRYGYRKIPKKLATNTYYFVEPGFDLSWKLISNNHYPDFYLTGKIKYRFVFGNSKFASENLFAGPLAGVGLTLIGFDKMQFSK